MAEQTDIQKLVDLLDRVKISCHVTDAELARRAEVPLSYIADLHQQQYARRTAPLYSRSPNFQRVSRLVEQLAKEGKRTLGVEPRQAPAGILADIAKARQTNHPVFGRSWGGVEPLDLLLGHIAYLEQQADMLARALWGRMDSENEAE